MARSQAKYIKSYSIIGKALQSFLKHKSCFIHIMLFRCYGQDFQLAIEHLLQILCENDIFNADV